MPKYYCEYCDIFLAHSSFFGRKQHCTGRKHIQNKIEVYKKSSKSTRRRRASDPPRYASNAYPTLSDTFSGDSDCNCDDWFYFTDLVKDGIVHAPNYDGTPEAERFGHVTYPSAEPPLNIPSHPYAFGKGFGKGLFFGKGFGGFPFRPGALPMPPLPGKL